MPKSMKNVPAGEMSLESLLCADRIRKLSSAVEPNQCLHGAESGTVSWRAAELPSDSASAAILLSRDFASDATLLIRESVEVTVSVSIAAASASLVAARIVAQDASTRAAEAPRGWAVAIGSASDGRNSGLGVSFRAGNGTGSTSKTRRCSARCATAASSDSWL